MKKIFTTALLMMLGAGAFAQITEGTKVVSGSIYTSGYIQENKHPTSAQSRSLSLTINPSYGSFIKENLELGIATSIGFSKSRYTLIQIHSQPFRITAILSLAYRPTLTSIGLYPIGSISQRVPRFLFICTLLNQKQLELQK